MIFRSAYHEKQFGTLQIGPAEFPERPADSVDHAGRHIDGAETAVCRVVGCAELACEQAGQGLHLIAPGEQREFLRIGGAQMFQPGFQRSERLFPADFLIFVGAALAARFAF